MKRVVIGLSGGVDSSVAAWKLKQEGYDVVGLFMRNWHDTTGLRQSECHWEDDVMFAEMTAKKLDIPFHFVDLSEQYRERVFSYMLSEYAQGRTPNPDVLCNREIKFDSFADEARTLGGDFVATGHYCRKKEHIVEGRGVEYGLLAGTDSNKDQSYFLCQISQTQLDYAMFPIGSLTKPVVRQIAAEQGLANAERKDSQGICFIGKVNLPTFLQQQLSVKEGDVVEIPFDTLKRPALYDGMPDGNSEELLEQLSQPIRYTIDDGKVIGKHIGAHFMTIGQRKGLDIGGHKYPLFVIDTNTLSNIVYVGEGHNHPALNRKGLFIPTENIHYIRQSAILKDGDIKNYQVRIRYRQPLQQATLYKKAKGLYIIFEELQRGITPGQFAAWYDNNELLGSGVIS